MLKPGVDLRGLKPQMALAFAIAQPIFHRRGYTCVITSATDVAPGRVQNSLHPLGLALDLRTKHVLRTDLDTLIAELREALGEQFDVVKEPTHCHIEYDVRDRDINPEER